MEGGMMSLPNPKPIDDFAPEEQKLIDQILECGWKVKVYESPEWGDCSFSCYFRFRPDRNKDDDLPPTTYGQTRKRALEIAWAQAANLAKD